ncbi:MULTISPECIES: amino acid ABC transporter permease [Streptomyces]|uniref:amino acid ABC transporter permease n=1 Tax=Streptomyces TaxID=1883 RepID=UPI001E439F32|nr:MULTISPECIES: amino acid ABC transporter permease [Streptomyces]UFQ18406.1 amino acid ABC transporter permease [Streptomyces huasconensis]WCL88019.1 amino acid ABC transporter permease [Streptomyces sp. JCM 35825]
MAWDEWERLKADAAGRHSTQMELNQASTAAAEPGGGGDSGAGTLRHTGKPWIRAAQTAHDLRTSTAQAKRDLSTGHVGVTSGAEGLSSLGALKAVLTSWEKRLATVRDECDALEPKLRGVARELGEVDVRVGRKADAVDLPEPRRER